MLVLEGTVHNGGIGLLGAAGSGWGSKNLFISADQQALKGECWHTAAFVLLFPFWIPEGTALFGGLFLPQLSTLKDIPRHMPPGRLTVKANYHSRQTSGTRLHLGADHGPHPGSLCF